MTNPLDISFRFIEAFKAATPNRGDANQFCARNDIDRGNLYRLIREPEKHRLQAYWVACLVNDFGVSADWVLTGRGEMK